MNTIRHDRIIPLRYLSNYSGAEKLDSVLWLPPCERAVRHIWLMTPQSLPTISIDDTVLAPQNEINGQPRWIDYGISELPTGFTQLRFKEIDINTCEKSFLLITEQLDFIPADYDIKDVEKKLWGLTKTEAGSTFITPCRTQIGKRTTFKVKYAAGCEGLPMGALIRFTVPMAFSKPQTQDPEKAGFTRIGQADCDVSIKAIETTSETQVYFDVICVLNDKLKPYEGFELSYTTDLTYIFPHTFYEVDRRLWYCKLPPLSAAVAICKELPFVSLEDSHGHAVEFIAGTAECLHLILPGRRFVSEKLYMKGIFTDYYRNQPSRGSVDSDLDLWLTTDKDKIYLGTPAGNFVDNYRFEMKLPELKCGIYRAIACQKATGEQIAISNPLEIINEENEAKRIFWGEIHGHTEMSDGTGNYGELYRQAKEIGGLDFAAAADHACYFTDNQWRWMCDITNSWNKQGYFVTLIGYEWAGKQVHRNIYTSKSELKLFRGMYPPTSNLDKVWPYFHNDSEIVAGPHAPLAHGIKWEFHDPDVERFVEIYSMWGASDSRENPLSPKWKWDEARMTVNEILNTGAKLGFTGGGDCHEGRVGFCSEDPTGQGSTPHTFAPRLLYRCGITAAIMQTLERYSLIKALRDRQTYATTGARILLDFTLSEMEMGTVCDKVEEVICQAIVHGTSKIRQINIIKDGTIVWSQEIGELDATIKWADRNCALGNHYYYIHVIQLDGHMAWSSPIWIARQGL